MSNPRILLLDEPFAALDIMTIKTFNKSLLICRPKVIFQLYYVTIKQEIYYRVDLAIVLSNGKEVAKDTPNNLIKNIDAKNAYFGTLSK